MAKIYPREFVGVADGTVPVGRADGRVIGAHVRENLLTKDPSAAQWAVGDTIFLGYKDIGETLAGITVNTGTSLGTTTLSVGTLATPAKYANAKTVTATDTPTAIGPIASTLRAGPSDTVEEIWLTIGVAAIAAGVELGITLRLLGA